MTYKEFKENKKVTVDFINKLTRLYEKFGDNANIDEWKDEELIDCYAETKINNKRLIILCLNQYGDCLLENFEKYSEMKEALIELGIIERDEKK